MARIIVRKLKQFNASNDGNSSSVGDEPIGNDTNDSGSIEPRTGQPDADDFQPTGNDSRSGERVNGNGAQFVDPTTATTNSDGTPKRGRGRPRGAGKGASGRANKTQTTQDISTLLFTIHFGMANMFRSPGLILTEDEASKLGEAITRVTELYDVQILPEKQMAWINLLMCAGGIYGPRIVASGLRKKQQKPQVITMPSNPVEQATQFSGGAI